MSIGISTRSLPLDEDPRRYDCAFGYFSYSNEGQTSIFNNKNPEWNSKEAEYGVAWK